MKVIMVRRRVWRTVQVATVLSLAAAVATNLARYVSSGSIDGWGLGLLMASMFLAGLQLDRLVQERFIEKPLWDTIRGYQSIPTSVRIQPDESGALVAFVQTLGGEPHVIRIPAELDDPREVTAFVVRELGFDVRLAAGEDEGGGEPFSGAE